MTMPSAEVHEKLEAVAAEIGTRVPKRFDNQNSLANIALRCGEEYLQMMQNNLTRAQSDLKHAEQQVDMLRQAIKQKTGELGEAMRRFEQLTK